MVVNQPRPGRPKISPPKKQSRPQMTNRYLKPALFRPLVQYSSYGSSLPNLKRVAKRIIRDKRKRLRALRQSKLKCKFDLRQQDGFLSSEFLGLISHIKLAFECLPKESRIAFPHKKIEQFVLSLSNLFLARSKRQLLSSSLLCLSALCDKPLINLIHENFQVIQKQLVAVCSSQLRQQGGMRDILDNWEKLSDSVILTKLREFISFCMTFGTFEYFGVSKVAADLICGEFRASPKPKSLTSFTFAVLDVIEFTFSRLCCCVESKSLGPLLHCSDAYLEWFDLCMKIQTWSKCLGHDPSLRGFSDQIFQSSCTDAINKGKEYVKMAKTHKARREMSGILSSIQIIYGDFQTNFLIGTPRSPPASLLIAGDPAVGKSTIYNIFINAFGNAHALPLGHNYVFVRNTFQEFMDGYETDKWAIVIDDAANVRPDCQQGVDPSVAETFIYINTPPITANMAELSKKGKVAIRPELIVVTTNIPDLNLPKYFECPAAAARRYPWRITPHVLPQFRKQKDVNKLYVETEDIDPSLCPDYWEFDIETVDTQPYKDESGNKVNAVKYNTVFPSAKDRSPNDSSQSLSRFSLAGALKWFIQQTTEHRNNQKKITKQIAHLSKIKFCQHNIPSNICIECQPSPPALPQQGLHFVCPWGCDSGICPHTLDICPKCGKSCCPENIGYAEEDQQTCELCGFCYDGFDCSACEILYEHDLREQTDWVPIENCASDSDDEIEIRPICGNCSLGCFRPLSRPSDLVCVCITCRMCFMPNLEGRCVSCSDVERLHHGVCVAGETCGYCYLCLSSGLREQSGLVIGILSGSLLTYMYCHIDRYIRIFVWYIIRILIRIFNKCMRKRLSRLNEWFRNKYYRVVDSAESIIEDRIVSISRNRIAEIGSEISTYLSKRNAIIAAFTIFASGLAIYKTINKINDPLLDEQLKYSVPEPFEEKVQANWAPLSKQMRRVSFLPQSVSAKAQGADSFISKVKRSVAYVEFYYGKGKMVGNLLFIGGSYAILNTHIFKSVPNNTPAHLVFDSELTHLKLNTDFIFDHSCFVKEIDDLTIIKLDQFGSWRDLISYFPKEKIQGVMKCVSIYRDCYGNTHEVPIEDVRLRYVQSGDQKCESYLGKINSSFDFAPEYSAEDRNTKDGHCGAPLINITGHGFCILGIHRFGGTQSLAASSIIFNSYFDSIINDRVEIGNLDLGELHEQGDHTLVPSVELEPTLRSRDPILFRKGGLGRVYGSLSSGTTKMKTKVAPTLMAPFWQRLGYRTDFVPPIFSNRSFHYALDDMTEPGMLITPGEVNFVGNKIVEQFFRNLPQSERELIQLYDLDTVVNGAPSVGAVNKMNFRTSMGFPSKKPKKHFFKQQADGNYEIPDDFRREVSRVLANAARNMRSNPIFSSCQKDEARKLEKVLKGDIRLFTSCPAVFVAAVRQVFGSLIRVIHRNPISFYCAFGVNAHSSDWDSLANHLRRHDLFFDGDHKKFDKKMLCFLVKLAIIHLGEFMIKCFRANHTMPEEDIIVLRRTINVLAYDTAFAYYDFNGTLMQFFKSHASGETLTTIVNNFVNLTYIMMAYRRCCPDDAECTEFFNLVSPITYGDDFALSVSREISDKFNFETCRDAMSTFGIIITPASKDKEGKKFCLFTDLEFLKRKFVWCHQLQRWTGPLDMASIQKSLLICLYEGNIPREQQCVEIMRSALFEMFFHGKDQFTSFRKNVFLCVKKYNLEDYFQVSTFPDYDALLLKYTSNKYVNIFEVEIDEPEFYPLSQQ